MTLGLKHGTVVVVPYCDTWPDTFNAESAHIRRHLPTGSPDVRLEHTGSTSVPGLAAKPVIDILAGVENESGRAQALTSLVRAGYDHRGEQGIPGRDFLRRGEPRQYHVHLTVVGSDFWIDHLDFRDWLRQHASVAAAYGLLKEQLALRFSGDREAYIAGKTEFIAGVLRSARTSAPEALNSMTV